VPAVDLVGCDPQPLANEPAHELGREETIVAAQ
jgi:hypothetical protein